jgi:acetyltransferase-like isoleucine patch superfamily enzyme
MDDIELERLVIASSEPGHHRVSHTRPVLHRRIGSTLFRVGIHLVHVVSNVLGDDIVSRAVRRTLLRLAGASMDSEATVLGGTYISKPANLRLGFHTMINRNCYFDLEAPIVFGDYAGAGHGSTFITTIHDIVPAMNIGVGMTAESITIGERAWIGANVTVLPGVNVGHDAIVAAGTVVVRDVPPNSLVAGVPGRVVRKDVRHWLNDFIHDHGLDTDHGPDTVDDQDSEARS